jgi:hypothetical protein
VLLEESKKRRGRKEFLDRNGASLWVDTRIEVVEDEFVSVSVHKREFLSKILSDLPASELVVTPTGIECSAIFWRFSKGVRREYKEVGKTGVDCPDPI